MTIQTDHGLAEKYETKRTGLTYDEAAEAAVLGYRVRSPSIPTNAFIHYEFGGLRIQFIHDGRLGSSSGWQADRKAQLDEWEIVPLPSEVKRDGWGKPIIEDKTTKPGSTLYWNANGDLRARHADGSDTPGGIVIVETNPGDRTPGGVEGWGKPTRDSWGRPIDG